MEIFNYYLPEDRIAQRPVEPRHNAKLLIIDRKTEKLVSTTFENIADCLDPNDLLVFNNSKVTPARILAETDTGYPVELLLINKIESKNQFSECWSCLGKELSKIKAASYINISEKLKAKYLGYADDNFLKFEFYTEEESVASELAIRGIMPIPPYIRNGVSDEQDKLDYQSIFAKVSGSIAAPTASLHFSEELIAKILNKNISISELTLHVGTASFLPIYVPTRNYFSEPGAEYFSIPSVLKSKIKSTREKSGNVIAVGTTSVRALESMDMESDEAMTKTEIFIKPGYKFNNFDQLITNFHQPGTSHLLLVEALLGRKLLEKSYNYALENNYRFLSYGDGMLIK